MCDNALKELKTPKWLGFHPESDPLLAVVNGIVFDAFKNGKLTKEVLQVGLEAAYAAGMVTVTLQKTA